MSGKKFSFLVPIVLLSEDSPAQQLGVFRHGMIGSVKRSASVDARVATQFEKLAASMLELPIGAGPRIDHHRLP